MKRALKRILILSFVAALALVVFRFIRGRRSGAPLPAQPWTPPSAPSPVHVKVHVAEPSPPAAAAEPASPEAPDARGQAPAVPGEVTPGIDEWAPVPPVADVAEALPEESQPPALLRVVEPEELRPAAIEPSSEQPGPAAAALGGEPDFLTPYFDRLAEIPDTELVERLATMAEPGLELVQEPSPGPPQEPASGPVEAPVAEETPAPELPPTGEPTRLQDEPGPEAPAEVELPEALEAALSDVSPAPIVPPPRRTAESYLDEGNVYFNVSQYGLAIDRYSTAIEMDPDLVAAYYNRANARTRSGDFEAALADYDQALVLQPFDADALNNRGMLHLYRANYGDALRDFNAALVIDPADTTVMVNRGLAHLHRGDAAAALVDFQEAGALDTEDAAAAYGAGQAAAVMGNRDEALRHIGRALALNPGYAREAAADPNLAVLQGDAAFLKLLRESGPKQG